MTTINPTPSVPSNKSSASSAFGCLHYLLLFVVSVWTIFITVAIHLGSWFVDQILLIEDIYLPGFTWMLVVWGNALLLAIPTVPLALMIKTPQFRAAYRTWALCIGVMALFAFARFFPAYQLDLALVAYGIITIITIAILLLTTRTKLLRPAGDSFFIAAAIAPIIALPIVVYGALGSIADSVLTIIATSAFGFLASIVLNAGMFRPLANAESKSNILLVGWSVGIALTILSAGFAAPGTQLLLLGILPTLGFSIAALHRLNAAHAERVWGAVALLIGAVSAFAMLFFDPAEISLLLGMPGDGEILDWVTRAIGFSTLIALGIGVITMILFRQPVRVPGFISIGATVTAWLIALGVYLFAGRPGMYGDQMFVILKDQADVLAAQRVPDRNARLRFVYNTLTQHADKTQASLRHTFDQLHIEYRPYYLVNAIEVNGGPLLRAYLTAQPEVDRIISSPHLRPLPQPVPSSHGASPAPTGVQWNIKMLGADRVWQEFHVTGKGIVIGQSDSGAQGDHPALSPTYRGKNNSNDYNWLDPWNHTAAPTDIGGHGTHTLGTMVGQGGIGVAPDAQWFGCVNLARNLGDAPRYLDCMQFMLAPYPQDGNPFRDGDPTRAAHVLNNSWGCPPLEGCDANALLPAVRALRAAGIFVVVSAGNAGPRCGSVSDPLAIYADAFSVGAIDSSGRLTDFSSRGPVTVDNSERIKPDIVAPGEDILSSFPGNTYNTLAGTSMAGPHVVGVVALMWSANPKLIGDIDRTEKILRETARAYIGRPPACGSTEIPNNATGYGIVDAYAAVQAALAIK